ncbi:hypothetical protein FBY03_111101 [Pseudomonas sp. SJZ079]|nr:hypothetical protein FBY03_111101 [Pseudomonas sp. SJZ079]
MWLLPFCLFQGRHISRACSYRAHPSASAAVKAFLLVLGLALCWAMFPRFVASAFALVLLGTLLVTSVALYLSVLFAPPRPR